jgi:hypothetical protein
MHYPLQLHFTQPPLPSEAQLSLLRGAVDSAIEIAYREGSYRACAQGFTLWAIRSATAQGSVAVELVLERDGQTIARQRYTLPAVADARLG